MWNLQTHEHTEFQISHYCAKENILVRGTKVLFIQPDSDVDGEGYFIHWSLESRIARTIPWNAPRSTRAIRSVTLDPTEDKFTVVYLDDHLKDIPCTGWEYMGRLDRPSIDLLVDLRNSYDIGPNLAISSDSKVHIETLALGDGEGDRAFRSTSHQIQKLPSRHRREEPGEDEESIGLGSRLFSLERGQELVIHTAPRYGSDLLNCVSPSPGVLYASGISWRTGKPKAEINVLHAVRCDGHFRDYEDYCWSP